MRLNDKVILITGAGGEIGGAAARQFVKEGGRVMPSEMAPLMGFLLSDEASYCTGGVYMADGGNSAG